MEPADFDDRICAVRAVRVAGQKPVLDILHNDEAYAGCSGSINKVLLELSNRPVASCTRLAVVQVRYGLGLVAALWTYISRSVALTFPNADWQPAVTAIDHKGPNMISEYRRG